jgi:hypothetical protein
VCVYVGVCGVGGEYVGVYVYLFVCTSVCKLMRVIL